MATIPTQTHPLLSVPFNAATDFTVLASHCENFADTLIESDDPALRLALYGRLAASHAERAHSAPLDRKPDHRYPSRQLHLL